MFRVEKTDSTSSFSSASSPSHRADRLEYPSRSLVLITELVETLSGAGYAYAPAANQFKPI